MLNVATAVSTVKCKTCEGFTMLEIIWFALWALLWGIYLTLDGFDLGVGILMPFLAHNDNERRVFYNSVGPFWDGNEVWLITAGGVTFAAFPTAYAVMFSALYAPLLILLFALILRAVALEFRSKLSNPLWRKKWDCMLFLSSLVPTIILGAFFSNLFIGIPIDQDGVYHGNLLKLLNPYALVGGIFFLALFCLHGALWVSFKSTGQVHARTTAMAKKLWSATLLLAVIYLIMTAFYTEFFRKPAAYAPLVIAVVGLLCVRFFLKADRLIEAFLSNAVMILGTTFFGVVGMFPNLVPSNMSPAFSLNIYNASSSPLTLKIMLGICICVVPIVLIYQWWVYRVFSHKITDQDLDGPGAY